MNNIARYIGLFAGVCLGGSVLAQQETRRPRQELYQDLLARHSTVSDRLSQADQRIEEIEAILERYDISAEDLADIIASAETEWEQLRLTVEDLERLLATKEELLKIDLETIKLAIAQALAEREDLLIEEDELREELDRVEPDTALSSAVSFEGMESRPFLLTGDRIAPFSSPFFSYRMIKVRRQDRRVVERRRYERESDAGTIEASTEPGGALYELVNTPEFDRAQTYVTLWVCADAIDGYYSVIKFLRDHDVPYNWQTDVDQPWTAADGDAPLENWGYDG